MTDAAVTEALQFLYRNVGAPSPMSQKLDVVATELAERRARINELEAQVRFLIEQRDSAAGVAERMGRKASALEDHVLKRIEGLERIVTMLQSQMATRLVDLESTVMDLVRRTTVALETNPEEREGEKDV